MGYFLTMSDEKESESHLTKLRVDAGLTVRELARQIGTNHPNVLYWEQCGRIAKTEFVAPMATALGVTVEEVLGLPKSRTGPTPGGKLGQVFEAASKLPRRQQLKIVEMAEAFIERYEREREAKAN